jgi:4-diphosphocytidyl-2-C-methyl-D-erythritol kinase
VGLGIPMSTDDSDVPLEPIVELARAKINLTLRVLGRRADGYHELESLVAFADVGDLLMFEPSASAAPTELSIEVTGPFARAITGENLVTNAARMAEGLGAPVPGGRVVLEKRLPVASGIGGGSTDAAAFLRAVKRAGERSASGDAIASRWPAAVWLSLAARIGADVPVCLVNSASLMRGIGDDLIPVALPSFDAVLVTPDARPPPDKTRRVFQTLGAPALDDRGVREPAPSSFADLDALLAAMKSVGNDLERPALSILPAIAEAKAALLGSVGCLHAFLSGAGPTCVGVYPSAAAAEAAAQSIGRAQPSWWVSACKIGE